MEDISDNEYGTIDILYDEKFKKNKLKKSNELKRYIKYLFK